MDEFKLDATLLVYPLEKRRGDLYLWECAMKHDGPLYQGEVSPLIKRSLIAKVVDMMCLQLNPLAPLDRLAFHLRLDAALDDVSDR